MEPSGYCRECGATVHENANYCSRCGKPVGYQSPEIERRQLTVLFCDMVGSTELSERLEPEDLGDLLNSYQRVCRDAILHYEGYVSQFLGDGVLAYFGYPTAHEDDAIRAIRASTRILDAVKLINEGIGKRLGAEVHVRVGLHTGVVVIANAISRPHDRLAVGETVNLAARIETVAPVDTIVVSAATARLVRGYFDLQSLSAQTLKGFSRPTELFRVLRPTGARTTFEAAARDRLTPHIDREAELNSLADSWTDSQTRATRAILISGEPGIGKSRVIHQFRRSVQEQGATVVECFCSPLSRGTSLAPIIEMLEQRIVERLDGAATAETKLETLRLMLSEHSRFGPEAFPLIAALLSLPGADEQPIRELSPVRKRARTLESLREWVVSSAERVPVAIFFEDVQWADPSTLDFLDLLVRSPCARALVCMTARPEFVSRWDDAVVRRIDLKRLPATDTDSMISQLDGGTSLSDFLIRRIAERSEGVPLYIEELTKLVIDRLRVNTMQPTSTSLLPSTIRGALEARLEQVGTGRSTSQLGAAIGRSFSYTLIRVVAGVDEAKLREDLDLLASSELAFVEGVPPQSTYTFKHALIQDAIYETIPKHTREAFHDRIFSALTTYFPELVEARPEEAAHHAQLARHYESAVQLLYQAGVKALARQAVVEAVQHLRRGLELLEHLTEPTRATLELALQSAIGPAYMATLGWADPQVERASARLLELATAAGDAEKMYLAMWSLWSVHFVRGELDEALVAARRVYDVAKATADPLVRITACHALGYTAYYRADFETAKHIALEALSISNLEIETRMASVFQLSSGSIAHGFCAAAHWLLGEHDQAAEMSGRWHDFLAKLKHAPSTALSLAFEGYLLHMQREPKKMRALALRLRTIAEQEGFQLWISMSHVFEAWALAHEGQITTAVERMNNAIGDWLTTNSRLTMCDNRVMQAEVLLLAGRPEEALRAIEEGKQICSSCAERTLEPELYRLEGEALELLGRRPEAVEATRRAISRAEELRALSLELRAVTQLHRLECSLESLERLRSTYVKFGEGFSGPDLRVAREYLDATQANAG